MSQLSFNGWLQGQIQVKINITVGPGKFEHGPMSESTLVGKNIPRYETRPDGGLILHFFPVFRIFFNFKNLGNQF